MVEQQPPAMPRRCWVSGGCRLKKSALSHNSCARLGNELNMKLPDNVVPDEEFMINVVCECFLSEDRRIARIFEFSAFEWLARDERNLQGMLQSILRSGFSEPNLFLARFAPESRA